MKIFISADIEGTCGIVHWDETNYDRNGYDYFRKQMSREVSAACEGAIAYGADEIVVKDAHDTARNIYPDMLPQKAKIFRGWAGHPFSMMFGIDSSFSGAFFTGYHNAAGTDTNPLSHTMTTRVAHVYLNGEVCSEAMLNGITASYVGVPLLLVTGDKGLCDSIKSKNPNIETVAVNEGCGNGSMSLQPDAALKLIREAAQRAVKKDPKTCMYPMPGHFCLQVEYIKHFEANSAAFYPGAVRISPTAVKYESDNWMDILTFIHFCM